MSLITENPRVSDVVLFEEDEGVYFSRDAVTVVSGCATCVVGQVMGKATLGTATKAVKSGGNTGAGTCTMDSSTPVLANAKVGIYTVRVVAVGTFIVIDPYGVSVGEGIYGAGATVTWADQVKFAFADDGSTHYIVGDGWDITVVAGSGKYTQVAPAALDGTQNACAVLVAPATPTADVVVPAITRPPAIFKLGGLAWTAAMTSPQKVVALAQLAALGFVVRGDYGI
jgi:hypothetical protein